MSVAAELVARVPGIQISIFDAAPGPIDTKTWCSWSVTEHRFESAVSSRWNRARVRGGGFDTTIDTGRYPYACIRSRDFFRVANDQIDDRCSITWSSRVLRIEEQADSVDILTINDDGRRQTDRFDLVLDGRSVTRQAVSGDDAHAPLEPRLIQHFGGFELEVPAGTVALDTATLMDFEVDQSSGTHFMYVLPLSERSMLVESTYMTRAGYAPADYERNVLAYVSREFGIESPRILYRESGALPMTLAPLGPASTGRVWTIGTRAGVGRASSGYAFDAIQRDSRRVVDALLAGRRRPGAPRLPVLSLLDRVLLSWLEADDAAAPQIFGRLFAKCPPESLIRFLSDQPTPLDLWNTMWAMPKLQTMMHTSLTPSAWPRIAKSHPVPA